MMGIFFYLAGLVLMILVYIEFKILAIYLPKWYYEFQMKNYLKKKKKEEEITKKRNDEEFRKYVENI